MNLSKKKKKRHIHIWPKVHSLYEMAFQSLVRLIKLSFCIEGGIVFVCMITKCRMTIQRKSTLFCQKYNVWHIHFNTIQTSSMCILSAQTMIVSKKKSLLLLCLILLMNIRSRPQKPTANTIGFIWWRTIRPYLYLSGVLFFRPAFTFTSLHILDEVHHYNPIHFFF